MPRERQYEEAEVVDAAADLFAVHGYQGTSLAMLLAATGLAKQSLYNGFGDKRSLYLKALDASVARFGALKAAMARAPGGRAAIGLFFERIVALCASADPAERACMVSAGLLEGVDDDLVQGRLCTKWAETREMLRAEVERGQKDGSIASALPSATLADLLMGLMGGLRVSARAGLGAGRLREIAELGLAPLDRN